MRRDKRHLGILLALFLLASCDSADTSDRASSSDEADKVTAPFGEGDEATTEEGIWSHPAEYDKYAADPDRGGGGAGDGDVSYYPACDCSMGEDSSGGWYETVAADGGGWESDPQGSVDVKAGDYDDNFGWDAYLEYLETHQYLSGVIPMDVTERYKLRVMTPGGQPIPNAEVTVYAGGEVAAEARTNSGGGFLFHPRPLGVGEQVDGFSYTVDFQGDEYTGTFPRSDDGAAVPIEIPVAWTPEEQFRMDLALVLDTTGSMSDEIADLTATWLEIADRIAALHDGLDLRVALVIYRDRGDEFVVKYFDFTGDVTAFQNALEDVDADGGGDYPEDWQAAMDTALSYLQWRPEAESRMIFSLADAPPQLYEDEIPYPELLQQAVRYGIKLHAIGASGSQEDAEYIFRQAAQYCWGHFLFLTYDNDVPGKPGSGTGSGGEDGYSVEQYVSGSLDDLVVALAERELIALLGEDGVVSP